MSRDLTLIDARHYANAADYAARHGNYPLARVLYRAALYVLQTVARDREDPPSPSDDWEPQQQRHAGARTPRR